MGAPVNAARCSRHAAKLRPDGVIGVVVNGHKEKRVPQYTEQRTMNYGPPAPHSRM